MPNHEEHCRQSKEKYDKDFSELHKWMDEVSSVMGSAHREHRHDPWTTPAEAKKLFGEMADHACLDHIKLDYEEKRGISRSFPPSGTYSLVCPYCENRFDTNLSSVMQETSCPKCLKKFQTLLATIKIKKSSGLRLVTSVRDVFVPVALSDYFNPVGDVFDVGDVVILSYESGYGESKEPVLIQNVNLNEYLRIAPIEIGRE